MRVYEDKDYNNILTLAYLHAGKSYVKDIKQVQYSPYVRCWAEYDTKGLRAFVFHISAPYLRKDIVWVTDRNNKYTLSTYRLMKKIHKEATKDIVSNVTTNHEMMRKFALLNNGILVGDTLLFPRREE